MKKAAIVVGVILVLGIIGLIGGQGSDDKEESITESTVAIETTTESIKITETTITTTIATTKTTTTQAPITTEKDTSRTVYITPTGKKYHYDAECGGKNSSPISLDKAKASYGPCSKCVH